MFNYFEVYFITYYYVFLDHKVCVEVEIDPYNPLNCPKFDFFGKSESKEKFQSRLNSIDPVSIFMFYNK